MLFEVVIGSVIIGGGWWWLTSPAKNDVHSPSHAAVFVRHLISDGLDGAQLTFQKKRDRSRAVTFTKRKAAVGGGLVFQFSDGHDFTGERSVLRAELSRRGIPELQSADERCLSVYCGEDVGLASLLIYLALEHVFKIDVEGECEAWGRGVVITSFSS